MATPGSGRSARALDLTAEVRAFLREHPEGWSHDDWLRLLDALRDAGYDTSRPDEIGERLERERLLRVLAHSGVPGLGAQRRAALADRFLTLWRLRQAGIDEVAATRGIPRTVAEAVCRALA